jgi:hypothetical protein
MTSGVTARPWEVCKALARSTWTRARATTHPALDRAAASLLRAVDRALDAMDAGKVVPLRGVR